MKERGSKKKNNIFSPKNLSIGFIVIIILLLIFNYFYPVFSFNNRFFSQNYENGELYSEIDEGLEEGFAGSNENQPCKYNSDCGGRGCRYCDKGFCNSYGDGASCNSYTGNHGVCKDGKCPDCSNLNCNKQCQECVFGEDGNPKCKNWDVTCLIGGYTPGKNNDYTWCYNGKCPEDCKGKCKLCQTCIKKGSNEYDCENDPGRLCYAGDYIGICKEIPLTEVIVCWPREKRT